MKLNVVVLGLVLLIPGLGSTQSFESYLKSRKQFGITQAASPEALTTFVGQRVLEVAGIVRGYMTVDGKDLLILDNPGGRELYISSASTPEWLKNTNTSARMLIRATKSSEGGALETELITACAEYQIKDFEDKELEKVRIKLEAERKAAEAKAARNRGTTSSRAGGRPPRLPGSIPTVDASLAKITPNLSAETLKAVPQYAAFIQSQNKKLSVQKAEEIAMTILAYSAKYGVDARLVVALIMCESGFDPNSTSHAGAQGLGQLMPATARGLGVSNSYDTEQNLFGTVKLLSGHLEKYTGQTGDDFQGLVLALAAYNAGSGAVRKYGGVPPYEETQKYVKKVIATYKKLIGQ